MLRLLQPAKRTAMLPNPDETLVTFRRVRNTTIGWLEVLTGSNDEIQRFGVNDLINDWDNLYVRPSEPVPFPPAVYTTDEVAALEAVDRAHARLLENIPKDMEESDVLAVDEWARLRTAAGRALEVFRVRGRLEDDGSPSV